MLWVTGMLSQTESKPKRFRLERWQLLFLLFMVVCGSLLVFNLAYKSILWDETPHLYGALLLSQGRLPEYLSVTFYPPLFDVITAGYFKIFSASLWAARLVSVTFGLLTLGVLFKLASKTYGRRVAFISCVIMATMPAFIWLSRLSFLEMALEFFFLATLLLFIEWLHTGKDKIILLSGLVLGLAFLAKYQALVAGLIILVSLPILLYRSKFKAKLSRFPLFILAAGAIIIPVLIAVFISGGLGQWINLLQINDAQANVYSARFPLPIFYLMEITFPGMQFVYPISICIFVLGALGLGLFVWRRKPEDKFFLIWFIVVYVFFTLIASRTWRYALPLFPVLAIAGASFVSTLFDKAEKQWKSVNSPVNKRRIAKFLATCLIAFTAGAVVYSAVEAEIWVAKESVYLPLPEAVHYVANGLNANDSLLVLCPINNLNINVAKFYLAADESKNNTIGQYPTLPPDSYTPNFNVNELAVLCQQKNVKYLLLDENTGYEYFNSTLTAQGVCDIVNASGNFTYETTFGTAPYRVFIFQTNPT